MRMAPSLCGGHKGKAYEDEQSGNGRILAQDRLTQPSTAPPCGG